MVVRKAVDPSVQWCNKISVRLSLTNEISRSAPLSNDRKFIGFWRLTRFNIINTIYAFRDALFVTRVVCFARAARPGVRPGGR